MDAKELLIEALQYYSIDIIKQEGNHLTLNGNYDVEVEANGLYKLRSDGEVIAPFDDVDELCRFILLCGQR